MVSESERGAMQALPSINPTLPAPFALLAAYPRWAWFRVTGVDKFSVVPLFLALKGILAAADHLCVA